MKIYWSDVRHLNQCVPKHRGRTASPGSAFAWSLLEYAISETWHCRLPGVSTDRRGRPFFPERTDICFSLSHTKGFVLAAVSTYPIGADVEFRRPVHSSLEKRLFQQPHGDLDLFKLWTLRESYFKLTGEGSLQEIPFSMENGLITGPRSDLHCRLYDEIPVCAAAVCSLTDTPSEKLLQIPAELLIKNEFE